MRNSKVKPCWYRYVGTTCVEKYLKSFSFVCDYKGLNCSWCKSCKLDLVQFVYAAPTSLVTFDFLMFDMELIVYRYVFIPNQIVNDIYLGSKTQVAGRAKSKQAWQHAIFIEKTLSFSLQFSWRETLSFFQNEPLLFFIAVVFSTLRRVEKRVQLYFCGGQKV